MVPGREMPWCSAVGGWRRLGCSGSLRGGALDGERERMRLQLLEPAGGGDGEDDERERRCENDSGDERWCDASRDVDDEGNSKGV